MAKRRNRTTKQGSKTVPIKIQTKTQKQSNWIKSELNHQLNQLNSLSRKDIGFSPAENKLTVLVFELFVKPLEGVNREYWVDYFMCLQTGRVKKYGKNQEKLYDAIKEGKDEELAQFQSQVGAQFKEIQ